MYVHNLLRLIGRSPRRQRTLRHRGLRKLALNSGTTRKSAKKAQPCIATTKPSTKPTVNATTMSTSSDDELSLRHLQRKTRRRCISTGTSTTVDELHKQGHRPPCQHCNCGNSTVFCTVVTQAHVVVQQRASHVQEQHLWDLASLGKTPKHDQHNRDIDHNVEEEHETQHKRSQHRSSATTAATPPPPHHPTQCAHQPPHPN